MLPIDLGKFGVTYKKGDFKNPGIHTVKIPSQDYKLQCLDCGALDETEPHFYTNVSYEEPHTLERGTCIYCGYQTLCKHFDTKTVTETNIAYNYKHISSFGHTYSAFVTEKTFCNSCNSWVGFKQDNTPRTFTEAHEVNTYGYCKLCGYVSDDPALLTPDTAHCITVFEEVIDRKTNGTDEEKIQTKAIQGARVTVGSKTLTTNANGQVFTYDLGPQEINVTAKGYRREKTHYLLKGGCGKVIFLEKEKDDRKPYFVQLDGYDAAKRDHVVDLRDYALHFKQNSNGILNIVGEVNWNGHGIGQIQLYQGESAEKAEKIVVIEGKALTWSASINPGKVFQPDRPVYLQIEAKDGKVSDPVKLELYIDQAVKITSNAGSNSMGNGDKEEYVSGFDWLGSYAFDNPDNDFFNFLLTNSLSLASDLIPVGFVHEENQDGSRTIRGVFGANPEKMIYNIKNMKTEAAKNNKNAFKLSTWEDMKEKINNFKKLAKGEYGSEWKATYIRQSFNTEVDTYGYIEAKLDTNGNLIKEKDGNGKVLDPYDGGIVIRGSGELVEGRTVFLNGWFPVFYEVKLGGDVSADFHLIALADSLAFGAELKKAQLSIPKIILRAGVGVRSVAEIGVKGGGGLDISMNKALKTKGAVSSEAAVTAHLLYVVSEEWVFAKDEDVLWDQIGSAKAASLMRRSVGSEEPTLTLVSRAYLEKESAWNPDMIGPRMRSAAPPAITTLQEGVMSGAMPQIQRVGDKLVMLFLRDRADRAIGNHTQLVYSVYDRGVWSEPQAVWESETADFYFDTVVANDQLYVAWQKSDAQADTTDPQALLNHVVSNSEIAVAVWNNRAEKFEDQRYLTDNAVIDMMPAISKNSRGVSVAWASNDQNDITGTTGTNTIYRADVNGSRAAAQAVHSMKGFIAEVCAGGDAVAYITVNSDGTSDVCCVSGGENIVAKENAMAAGLAYEDGAFLWQENGALYSYVPGDAEAKTIIPAEEHSVSSSYRYIENGSNPIVVWHEKDESGQQLIKACAYENGTWSLPIILMDDLKDSISFFDAVTLGDQYAIILNTANYVDGEMESSALKFALVQQPHDVELTDVYLNRPEWDEQKQEINLYLTNNGVRTIPSVSITVSDEENTYLNKNVEIGLAPGETACITEKMDISRIDTVRQAVVRVEASGDQDESNQAKLITLGQVETAFSVDAYEADNHVIFLIAAENYSTTDAHATVTMLEDGRESASLQMQYLGELDRQSNAMCTFIVDKSEIEFEDGLRTFFFRLTAQEEEWNDLNNVLSYTVKHLPEEGCKEHSFLIHGFEWSDDLQSCLAVFKCTVCGYEERVPCVIASEVTPPKGKEPGKIVYTASVEFKGKTFTDTLTFENPAMDLPNTGDESRLGVWLLLACAACCGLLLTRKKTRG